MSAFAQLLSTAPHVQRGFSSSSLLEQGSGLFNEDALLAQDNLFGVFDGASSLRGELYRGKSGAWWAAHLARAAFADNDDELSGLAERANRAIAKGMTVSGVDMTDRLQLWSTSAAAVRVRGDTLDYVQVGDVLILCIFKDGRFSLPVPFYSHDRAVFEQWELLVRLGFNNIRELLAPQVERVRLRMNRQFGVLNGEQEMSGFLQTGKLSTRGLRHLLIFTDGLHLPADSSGGVDFAGMVECFLKRGLSGLHQAVRGIERTDPECRRFPRFKMHDDIAAVALSFNNQ
ncbi:MAG: protein phosphatase 2C domain-containing protein [Desulfuromonadales bacterium]|nr:protein phosphatase 2C domain-containing protein [Desulfuromonadales bacterium]